MVKSAAVVIGCYVLSVLLVLATDPLLSRLFPGDYVVGRVPSSPALAASTAFFILIALFCAWLCARLAPDPGSRPLLWFFVIGEAMGVATIIPNWNRGWPHWYWLSWLFAWPVCCWLGLRAARRVPRTA